jgi:hypothetical protein
MSGRLGQKLASRPGSVNPGIRPSDQELCLIVDERWGFCCEFQTVEGDSYLLPFQRLVFVETNHGGDTLKAAFSSHEVVLKGHNLAQVKAALARSRNFVARAFDVRRKGDYGDEQLFISSVEVTEIESNIMLPPDARRPAPEEP